MARSRLEPVGEEGPCGHPVWDGRYWCVLPTGHESPHEAAPFGRQEPFAQSGSERVKASDIDTDEFLSFIAEKGKDNPAGWVQWWDLQARWPDMPSKVLLAKARGLLRSGRLGGCGCGCRGDFHIPLACCGGSYQVHNPDCPRWRGCAAVEA